MYERKPDYFAESIFNKYKPKGFNRPITIQEMEANLAVDKALLNKAKKYAEPEKLKSLTAQITRKRISNRYLEITTELAIL